MEGGFLLWRVQRRREKLLNPKVYREPLPPPPPGQMWRKNLDNSWTLLNISHGRDSQSNGGVGIRSIERLDSASDKTEAKIKSAQTQSRESKLLSEDKESSSQKYVCTNNLVYFEHVVMEEDTLPGLCLRYHVSATTLRRVNVFSGNNIKGFKILRIPVDPNIPVVAQTQTEDVLIQKFRNMTMNEGKAEARIYLEENNWDIDKAISAWRGDESWSNTTQTVPESFSVMEEASTHGDIVQASVTIVNAATVVPSSHVSISNLSDSRYVQVVTPHAIQQGSRNCERYDMGYVPPSLPLEPEAESLML